MSSLERRTTTTNVDRPSGPGSSGTGVDPNSLEYGSPVIEYDQDLPTAFRQGARASTEIALRRGQDTRAGGELVVAGAGTNVTAPRADTPAKAPIASAARQLDKPRKAAGRIVQRRIGWAATPKAIIVVIAERELQKRADGKFSPSGAWLIENRTTHPGRALAEGRTGSVLIDGSPSSGAATGGSGQSADPEAAVAQAFPEAATALGALPTAVRRPFIGAVPSPTRFEGSLMLRTDASTKEATFVVDVLRMDDGHAVAVHAERPERGETWKVTQATYDLVAPTVEQA